MRKAHFSSSTYLTSRFEISPATLEQFSISKSFGWDIDLDLEIFKVLLSLSNRGKVFDVWQCPQVEAIEWLIGIDDIRSKLRSFPYIIVRETFLAIVTLHLVLDVTPTMNVETSTSDSLVSIRQQLKRTIGEYKSLDPWVLETADRNKVDILANLETALEKTYEQETEIAKFVEFRNFMNARFTGSEPAQRGKPTNWRANATCLIAANIYRTCTGSPPERDGMFPSFKAFLERFLKDLPNLGEVDVRRLARRIWDENGYKGELIGGEYPQLYRFMPPRK